MKTVALISGGKDSCFNMMQCVAEGHQIVALANLKPHNIDELDSFMYQTVGHQAIEMFGQAMGLPLYQHTIQGTALCRGKDYQPQKHDEVEDLYQLLVAIQKDMEIEAVAVGAILSDYQRVRVESVCQRLGLTSLAYLWRRHQNELLQEMVQCGMQAILIKVAALGLEPEKHLGMSLQQILPYMMKMYEQYGLNVCGEGGEYETFTLDCPLFQKKIVIDEAETVIHSADAFAPVGYIRFKKLHLEDKNDPLSVEERVKALCMMTSQTLVQSLLTDLKCCTEETSVLPTLHMPCVPPLTGEVPTYGKTTDDYFCVGPVVAVKQGDLNSTCSSAMKQLREEVTALGRSMCDVFSVCLYVANMEDFASINAVYRSFFDINPPVRICVGACLPEEIIFAMDCQGCRTEEKSEEGQRGRRTLTMHVQGISHWAPANIGPYSQATVVDRHLYVAGQIPLVPGTMQLVTGGVAVQCALSLRHTVSVMTAACPGRGLAHVLLCVCYITHPDIINMARQMWRDLSYGEQGDICLWWQTGYQPLVEFVVVPSLPKAASVEWQVYATSEDQTVQEVTLDSVDGRVYTQCLYSEEDPSLFTSCTRVYVLGQEDQAEVAETAVAQCVDNYSNMLEMLGRRWSDVPLLRLFFPAGRFAYSSVLQAWIKSMEHVGSTAVPVSMIPVVQMEHKHIVLLLCH